ncbi:piggyBac transposable element-derived protein 4-like [Hyla sarda]|uniref:piggyBac transposable element-derived protein 4-like n=1 Tax=Hyla sarda TaxID=327740 RepID=UPI0024C221E6|nr:piggyBac transposable element-derived protein 4-like [Hyla sarda]
MSGTSQWMYSLEEAYEFLASEMESVSDDGDPTFLISSSSSSSSSSDSDVPPPRRRRRRATAAAAALPGPSRLSEPSEPSDSIWVDSGQFTPQIPGFTGNAGMQFPFAGLAEKDFFKFFFTDELLEHLVAQTNIYANQYITAHPTSSYAHPNRWTPVTPSEMAKFWGIMLSMGLLKKPSIRSYWTHDLLYNTPMYRMAMSRTRFEQIMRFLHYNDNATCPPRDHPSYDRLYKICPLIDHLNAVFQAAYVPGREISIDESLVHFKGRLQFRQYLPSKRARYGVKMYKLCESASGYTYRFRVYEGKDSSIEPPECPPVLGITGKIVWDLVHPILDQGYHLYLDNFYTSVPLFKCLTARGTVACGTVRKNQRGLPKPLLAHPMRKHESRALCSDGILCVRYKDKREVLVLTTIHGHATTPVSVRGAPTEIYKPDCILAYNKFMGGVDLSDQVLKPYSAMRKTRAWYKKLAVHMVQMALYNAFVLYRHAGQRGTFLEFQEVVIRNLIFGDQEDAGPSTSESSRIVPGQHFPSEIPHTGKKGRTQKKCRVCYKRGIRRDTTYQCETCPTQPGLCISCFKIYHTSLQF